MSRVGPPPHLEPGLAILWVFCSFGTRLHSHGPQGGRARLGLPGPCLLPILPGAQQWLLEVICRNMGHRPLSVATASAGHAAVELTDTLGDVALGSLALQPQPARAKASSSSDVHGSGSSRFCCTVTVSLHLNQLQDCHLDMGTKTHVLWL